ncbi:MAG: aldo/keto reductase [Candidatus Bathyarchaeota archaeon]|nr:MAG: aldo/keto reductase [Candidatus Bathyarchaeota archaeon]
MQYRSLGQTGLDVSVIGIGAAMLGQSRASYAVKVVERAIELGVNYIDTARGYWNSEIKLGSAIKGQRSHVYLSSKTHAFSREDAWRELKESLERLQTSYLDNYHLHALHDQADIDRRLGPGGALEALIEAREQGLVHHIGCTSHRSSILIQALKHFEFETILVPMNFVEREPLEQLIPLCQQQRVGITIMKPVATGLLPARLALKWLLNQPIASAVPGMTTIEEAEENALVGHLENTSLTLDERAEVHQFQRQLDHVRCRICRLCEPCPQQIPIGSILGTDVMYDHYRNMGPDMFHKFPWDIEQIKKHVGERKKRITAIQSCTQCGECESKCPYQLPIIDMLHNTINPMTEMLQLWNKRFGIE